MERDNETVFVGLSGGVDSSVAAKRLLDAGKNVVGVFIKTWQPDFLLCDWEKERLDAMRVAAHLGIPFYTCDAVEEYKNEVAMYMIEEYKSGRTPNPDVMCNQHVKFGAFLKWAIKNGADKVATGHYAQVEVHEGNYILKRGIDANKDQSYFLWTLTQEQLSKIYFPVGNTRKEEIRKEAEEAKLPTFKKQDSQGVCFLGDIDMKEFLSHYIESKKGDVLDSKGTVIGEHDGALFYTLGQRHGFSIQTITSENTAHYVISKDVEKNTITVAAQPPTRNNGKIELSQTNLDESMLPIQCEAQYRYRQTPFSVRVEQANGKTVLIPVENKEQPSAGQSCVLYKGDVCLGGGIIETVIE